MTAYMTEVACESETVRTRTRCALVHAHAFEERVSVFRTKWAIVPWGSRVCARACLCVQVRVCARAHVCWGGGGMR